MIAYLEEVKSLWRSRFLQKDDEWHLYLHVPFCYTPCKYCFYTGNLVGSPIHKQDYQSYFYEYLPRVIKGYEEIIVAKPFSSVYVGGGTPNAMTPDTMRHVFGLIPGFKEPPVKAIDMHPAYVSKEQIDVLAEFGFTLICFGVQTFDKETLRKNNRATVTPERLKELVDYCTAKGLYTSIDLMCYLNSYNEKDINLLKEDIRLAENIGLSFMTINPNLHFILHDTRYATLFTESMKDYFSDHPSYIPEYKLAGFQQFNERSIFRVVKHEHSEVFQERILTYFADDFPEASINILGIGDFNNPQKTMSYTKDEFFYVEHNVNGQPRFEVKYIKEDAGQRTALKMLQNRLQR